MSGGHLCEAEATTEPASETSNPRGFDTRRRNKITKEVSNGYLFKKKARDGLRVSSGHLCEAEATTEPAGETSNLRALDWARFCNKNGYLLRYPFFCKKRSARRGSNPRPPPWQGGAPPLSHSRIVAFHTQEI